MTDTPTERSHPDMWVDPEEYARHLGPADLLRECLDGRTGQ